MVESIIFKFWDDSTDVDNSATDFVLAFFSGAARSESDVDLDLYLGHVDFLDDSGRVVTGTSGNVTFYCWEDHDVKLPYIITDSPTYSSLYLSTKVSQVGGRGATDKVAVLIGMRPLNYS
jgi:hypothetical protein